MEVVPILVVSYCVLLAVVIIPGTESKVPPPALEQAAHISGKYVKSLMRQFLPKMSGVIRIGNETITLPDDLSKMFAKRSTSEKRSRQHHHLVPGLDDFHYTNEEERKPGLVSIPNIFRAGCVILDLMEISESAQNGLY